MAKEYITPYQEGRFRIMGVQGPGSGLMIYERFVTKTRGEGVVTQTPIEIFKITLRQLEVLALYVKYNGDVDKIAESLPSSSNRPHDQGTTSTPRHVRLHLSNLQAANNCEKRGNNGPSVDELIEIAKQLELLSCCAVAGLKVILDNIHRAPKGISRYEGEFEAELDLYDRSHAIGKRRRLRKKTNE